MRDITNLLLAFLKPTILNLQIGSGVESWQTVWRIPCEKTRAAAVLTMRVC